MKHQNFPRLINIKTAKKWLFLTEGSLLASAFLYTNAAHATENCPSAYAIKTHYVRDNAFIERAENSDWLLKSPKPLNTYDNKTLELVSVKLDFNEQNLIDANGRTFRSKAFGNLAQCSYNYPGSTYAPITLTIKAGGRLTYKSYILHRGAIKTSSTWNLTTEKSGTKIYLCDGKAESARRGVKTDLSNQCGGFTFENHAEGEQYYKYWDDAWSWCRGWVRCTGAFGYRNYIQEMRDLEYKLVETYDMCKDGRGAPYKCNIKPAKPYCNDITCSQEIKAMNRIIAGHYNSANDQDEGMAKYLRMCWAHQNWMGKQWPTISCDLPSNSAWPDYSSLLP